MLIVCFAQGLAVAHDYEHTLNLHDAEYEQCQLFDGVTHAAAAPKQPAIVFNYEPFEYSNTYRSKALHAKKSTQLIRAPPVSIF